MKFLLSIVLIGIFVISAFGQNAVGKTTVCTDKTIANILSRGIKIGAKIDDVLNMFASTDEEKRQVRNNRGGPIQTDIGYESFGAGPKSNDERFNGVSGYSFDFLDGHLVSFSANYNKPRWLNVSQFRDKLAENFSLPKIESWNMLAVNQMNFQCENYLINLYVSSSLSSFGVTDTRIYRMLETRRKNLEDEQRERDIKVFKP